MPVRSGAKDMVGVSFVVSGAVLGVRAGALSGWWCRRAPCWKRWVEAMGGSDRTGGSGMWRDDRGTGSVRSPLRLPRTRFGHYSTVVTGVSTPVHPRPFRRRPARPGPRRTERCRPPSGTRRADAVTSVGRFEGPAPPVDPPGLPRGLARSSTHLTPRLLRAPTLRSLACGTEGAHPVDFPVSCRPLVPCWAAWRRRHAIVRGRRGSIGARAPSPARPPGRSRRRRAGRRLSGRPTGATTRPSVGPRQHDRQRRRGHHRRRHLRRPRRTGGPGRVLGHPRPG